MINGVVSDVLGNMIWASSIWVGYSAIRRFQGRHERWFWRKFLKQKLDIVFVEYRIDASTHDEKIAQSVGNGFQVSKGMALAVGKLVSYCQKNVTKHDFIRISGDKTSAVAQNSECPVCLGSKNNLKTMKVLSEIERLYAFPFDTQWDETHKVMLIKYLNNPTTEFRPLVSNGEGTDYALVVTAQMSRGHALVIAGAHMWGTQGAVEAITNREWLVNLRRTLRNSVNFAFVLEVTVVQDQPQTCRILHAISLTPLLNI